MKTVNISAFMSTIKCDRCPNKALYDDTPYERYKNDRNLEFEIACPICGNRMIYDKNFKRIN